ncbi:MAG: ABC transporter ATP-binding protein [Myxococcaceae bacterium]|nr:ABC transporter ATP-binding protein [Myxococcaceae bacterium]
MSLVVEKLSVQLLGRAVLRDVSLRVEPGEFWTILGPNGAGKSTLLRAMLGLIPFTGSVCVDGQPVQNLPRADIARRVAWVPQAVADDVAFTGLELAMMGRTAWLPALGLPSEADFADAQAWLDAFGVGHLAQRRMVAVSGGERRLVGLARAMMQRPKTILLDEPTAFLDLSHQRAALRRLKEETKAGLAALAVLHDVNAAMHVCTHALLLKEGHVLAQGPLEQVVTGENLSQLYGLPMTRVSDSSAGVLFAPSLAHQP